MVITSIKEEIKENSRIPKTLGGIVAKVQRIKKDKHREILANHIWFRICDFHPAELPEMKSLKLMATYTRDEFIETETVVQALKSFGFSEDYTISSTNSMLQAERRQRELMVTK
tara:strand:- start:1583 stop:1924 length:342 start_codon:yes stop_codon:yes gene_type:complete